MANKVTIDVVARFVDQATNEAKDAAKAFDTLEKRAEGAARAIKTVGKAKPKVNVDSNDAMRKLDNLDRKLSRLQKVHNVLVKIKDSNVLSTLGKMSTGLKSLTSKAWSIAVKVPNAIFGTLNKLKSALFNVKNLIVGIAAAWATQKLVMNPINVADAYSSEKISFSTLLG